MYLLAVTMTCILSLSYQLKGQCCPFWEVAPLGSRSNSFGSKVWFCPLALLQIVEGTFEKVQENLLIPDSSNFPIQLRLAPPKFWINLLVQTQAEFISMRGVWGYKTLVLSEHFLCMMCNVSFSASLNLRSKNSHQLTILVSPKQKCTWGDGRLSLNVIFIIF